MRWLDLNQPQHSQQNCPNPWANNRRKRRKCGAAQLEKKVATRHSLQFPRRRSGQHQIKIYGYLSYQITGIYSGILNLDAVQPVKKDYPRLPLGTSRTSREGTRRASLQFWPSRGGWDGAHHTFGLCGLTLVAVKISVKKIALHFHPTGGHKTAGIYCIRSLQFLFWCRGWQGTCRTAGPNSLGRRPMLSVNGVVRQQRDSLQFWPRRRG